MIRINILERDTKNDTKLFSLKSFWELVDINEMNISCSWDQQEEIFRQAVIQSFVIDIECFSSSSIITFVNLYSSNGTRSKTVAFSFFFLLKYLLIFNSIQKHFNKNVQLSSILFFFRLCPLLYIWK